MSGPVEVRADGERIDAGQPRQRAVLAALLADAGRAVPVDTIVDRVWGQAPPRGARASLQAHVTRIRQMLGDIPLTFAAGCYTLGIDPLRVDLHRMRHLAAQARSPKVDDPERLALLREAVDLWRGEPLAGVRGPWAEQYRQVWRQEHVAAAVAWGEAELRSGDPAAAIAVLADLAGEHPLTESLAVVLMRALAAAGRPAEALARYETVRRHLRDELGADPSPELQAAYQVILRGSAPPGPPVAGPAQLPPDVLGFTGRADQLARLDGGGIVAVSGMAGVGKTTLAVHWAHTVAHRFPDGQLYVNLRGFDAGGRVMDPADAVRGFLDALGVARDRVPDGLDAQWALYRSLLAGKRMLVLLDNARDAEQVRPLLPAGPGTAAVVTSRNRLAGLLAVEGARLVTLDVLGEAEARELLRRRLPRAGAEPAAVSDIVAACGRLPLALAIAAARAQQSDFPLSVLAAELRETGARLDALDAGDPDVQVRAVFACSYAALPAPAARLFRLLGAHPGPDVSVAAASALAGLPARRLLAELAQASLVTEHAPGRYILHDLLRAYAADLASSSLSSPALSSSPLPSPSPSSSSSSPSSSASSSEVAQARGRLLDHLVLTAHAADRLLYPARDPIELPLPPGEPEPLTGHDEAMAWLAAEHRVVLAAVRLAADTGHDARAWQLAWALDTFLFRRGLWHDQGPLWTIASGAAERLGNLTALAIAYRSLGRVHVGFRRHDEARASLSRAAELYEQTGNPAGQGFVHNSLGQLAVSRSKDYELALEHTAKALELYRQAGSPRGQAIALSQFGWFNDMLGRYEEAIPWCEQALELHRQVGDRRGEADVLDSLAYAHHHLGRYDEAAARYRRAAEVAHELGDQYAEAQILDHLGDTHAAAGSPDEARTAWASAVRILSALGHADERDVRAKLDRLGH